MGGLARAKDELLSGGYTCVICSGDEIFTSTRRGVAPLVLLCKERGFGSFIGASAADKVVGRATAFLYLLLGVSELYAGVISKTALDLLAQNGVSIEYGECVPNIINRVGDGICPFEEAVLGIADKNDAFSAILLKIKELKIEI